MDENGNYLLFQAPWQYQKLLDEIARKFDVTLIDAVETDSADLTEYDVIGFASGIYYSKFHKSVLQFAEQHLPRMKKAFFIYTYGAKKKAIQRLLRKQWTQYLWSLQADWRNCQGPSQSGGADRRGGIF